MLLKIACLQPSYQDVWSLVIFIFCHCPSSKKYISNIWALYNLLRAHFKIYFHLFGSCISGGCDVYAARKEEEHECK